MSLNNFSERLLYSFSRFFISGVCILIFLIIPLLFIGKIILNVSIWNILDNWLIIIFFCIGIGILFDLFKFYKISGWILGIYKFDLAKVIVESFKISTDDKNKSDIKEISRIIHERYIRKYDSDIYEEIARSRIYPDILSTAWFSSFFSSIVLILFVIACPIWNIHMNFYVSVFSCTVLIIFILSLLLLARKKLGEVYSHITEVTRLFIRDSYEKGKASGNIKNFKDLLLHSDNLSKDVIVKVLSEINKGE